MLRLPSPQELGFPPKYDSWRPGQEEFALAILNNKDKRAIAGCAPTGFGKTGSYMAAAVISNEPTCIVTANRGLQDQLMDDFSGIGLVDLRGRNNYTCDMREDMTCEDGYASGKCPYKGSIACPASQAEMRAASSRLVVTNYSKWTACRKKGQGMEHFTQVIFDEGHEAPNALAEAMQVVLHYREIEEDLGMNFLVGVDVDNFCNWKNWAILARARAEEVMLEAKFRIIRTSSPKSSWIKHYVHMKRLLSRLGILSTANADNWVVEQVRDGYQFDPIRPAKYAEGALLLHMAKIIIPSATLRPKTLEMIGLLPHTYKFMEFDSEFDPKRCPIYWIPTMRVDYRASDLSMLWVRLDQLASRRRDRNGIVHTKSYLRRDAVVQSSRYRDSMIVNERGEPPTEMIEQFRGTYPGAILVSPSVGAGYDFPMKQCEWQFICKVPFPDGRAKIMQARNEQDREYGYYLAMQDLVQTCGRGMRRKEDQCENVIPDDHLEWFLNRYGHLAPRSFHGFFKKVTMMPPPPERL